MAKIEHKGRTREEMKPPLLAEGKASIFINEAITTTSKSGKPMFKLKVSVTDSNDKTYPRTLNILHEADWRVEQLCSALGHPEWYDNKDIPLEDLKGERIAGVIRHTINTVTGEKQDDICKLLPLEDTTNLDGAAF